MVAPLAFYWCRSLAVTIKIGAHSQLCLRAWQTYNLPSSKCSCILNFMLVYTLDVYYYVGMLLITQSVVLLLIFCWWNSPGPVCERWWGFFLVKNMSDAHALFFVLCITGHRVVCGWKSTAISIHRTTSSTAAYQFCKGNLSSYPIGKIFLLIIYSSALPEPWWRPSIDRLPGESRRA